METVAFRLHGGGVLGTHRTILRAAAAPEAVQAYEQIKSQIKQAFATHQATASSEVIAKVTPFLSDFLDDYGASNLEAGQKPEMFRQNMLMFLKCIKDAVTAPHQFHAFHEAIRKPFDFYRWGNEFIRPMVVMDQSRLLGLEHAQRILQLIEQGDNVVILSNHQTEADPQVLSILLEREKLTKLAEKMVFVAGHKVTNDPVAIPFSMGRNLICIHSKKHIRNPPEQAHLKTVQNMASMSAFSRLMTDGGQVFWVAPSGGRDRSDESGKYVVSPFDLKALDMFKLLAKQSQKPTHFFPMAMYTHALVPPPKGVSSDLGESRSAKRGAVSVAFLPETDGLGELGDRVFAEGLQKSVEKAYEELCQAHQGQPQQ